MTSVPLISTVIPTYNRMDLLPRAIDSALAQTGVAQEIIVIDDGSTDGTARRLAERYGERVRCVSQPNGGVSRARNRGMALARGDFIALLDSDDLWLPGKLAAQLAFLASHPEYGMVLCDVQRVDGASRPTDTLRRRDAIPVDGHVLAHVLLQPALVPASVLMRREVFDTIGGFDESLRTAEDIDFHLRVAARYPIGVIDEVFVQAMRGHEGLSADAATQSDYVRVVERFIATNGASLSETTRRQALFTTYARNARSALVSRRIALGCRLLGKAVASARTGSECAELLRLGTVLGKVSAVAMSRATGLRRT
jgi:glycosyltransferase involved in cell wall biosynthesis